MRELLMSMLKRHEGFRAFPYLDTVGKLTIGYGRNLSDVGISIEEAVTKIRGPKGTEVKLEIIRDKKPPTIKLTIVRDNIKVPSVKHQILADNIGYMQINQFSGNDATNDKRVASSIYNEPCPKLI